MKHLMQNLGFSEGEAILYSRLLEIGSCTISECLKGLDLSRPHAYSLMRNLVKSGLVAEEAGKPNRYHAIPPQISLEYLASSKFKELETEKERFVGNLELLKLEAMKSFSNVFKSESEVGPDMLIFRGPNLIVEWAKKLKGNLKGCLRVISKKPLIMKMVGAEDIETKANVTRKILCETELTLDTEFVDYLNKELEIGNAEIKYSDCLPIKLAIFDDFAAIITLNLSSEPDNFLLFLTQNRELVTFLTVAFDCIWENSKLFSPKSNS